MTHRCPCCGSEVEGESIDLSPTQTAIMGALRRIPGRVVSTGELISQIYQLSDEPETAIKSVHVQVHRLRKKLGDVIETMPSRHGGGYRIRMEKT